MSRNKKKRPTPPATPLRWEFDPDIPTEDFLEEYDLEDTWGLQEAVEVFIHWLEQDRFLTWEAVVREEQGLPLTAKQEKVLDSLLNFSDEPDDQILYIDEFPRNSEPWYVILNKLAPRLLIEPFRTFDIHNQEQLEGWDRIMTALDEHGKDLSLPPGVASVWEVVPAELRHKLGLQYCFDMLDGLGQEDELILDEADPWRVDELIQRLREHKESVAYFSLTLESLLTRVILPERDRPIFLELMQAKLGLASAQEPIADHLSPPP
jgi:hypothetical protein